MPATSIINAFRVTTLFCVATLSLCSVGCGKKSQPNTETPAGAPAQPSSTSAQPAAPAAPTGPVPSFSAANKVGLFAYPGKGQSHDRQLIDESDCYNSAQQQTGVNADTPAPQPPSSADVQAAQAQATDTAPQQRGGRAKGAARGAVGGAVVGGIAGDEIVGDLCAGTVPHQNSPTADSVAGEIKVARDHVVLDDWRSGTYANAIPFTAFIVGNDVSDDRGR